MRTANNNLAQTLFGQTRGDVLGLLFLSVGNAFFVRQIARAIATSPGTVQRELTALTKVELVLREKIGNQVFYRANQTHPVYSELRSLLQKTQGIFQLLSEALHPLSKHIQFAFVYGSIARSEENAASDIDLMVIGSVSLDDVLEYLVPLEQTLRRPINPTIYSSKELRAKLKANHHFLRSVQSGMMFFLLGSEDEFRKIR